MTRELTDKELLAELGVKPEPRKVATRTPQEERIIAGFEEIQRFVEEHGRAPRHGEDKDIFERLYAVRLNRLRELPECRSLLQPLDHQGLIAAGEAATLAVDDELDDAALLAELGVEAETDDITKLRHVRSSAEKKAAEEIANRQRCEDFDRFKPLFDEVQDELDRDLRTTRPFGREPEVARGHFFILGGQKVYVAEVGEKFLTEKGGHIDARLRVIFDNGTESNMLMRSLQRALYKDEAGRRITDSSAGPLFGDHTTDSDEASGTIYVLRSKSDEPIVKKHRDLLHKIGVTGGKVERRIANAKTDASFLLADVEIVATYKLYNINRTRLESLLHRIFAPARIDIQIKDRFGNPVKPREWFLGPLSAINEAVERIKNGTIKSFIYDPQQARLVKRQAE